ncbi:hypothetical protein HNQ51_002358 [Inhella inkyongensis]|uniref:Pilus assembly protein n=1 Tax=Inhella inkyongensis TaxID=392593 RepID=A0A840S9F0_9BURK|nr:hypothetical protein [Inhella inkyongensis]
MKFRLRAAGWHAGLSALIGAAVAALVFLLWHPWPYGTIAGGTALFLILMGVDLCMGPLLTLVVAQQRKPRAELVRDLCVIGLLQLSALGYGVHVTAQARPVVLAWEGQRLRLVTAMQVAEEEWGQRPREVQALPWNGPLWLGTRETRADELMTAVAAAAAGQDIGTRPSFWKPLDEATRTAIASQSCSAAQLQALGRPQDGALLSCPFLLARSGAWHLALEREGLKVVGLLPG